MGRPVNKRYFGNPATKSGDQYYIQAWFSGSVAGAEEQCFIVKQTGTRTFKVESVANSDQGEVNLVNRSLGAISEGEGYIEAAGTGLYALSAGQDETAFDNSPTTEGTFSGGTGHSNGDVITLSDGSTITVDANGAGVVTQFTVTTGSTSGFASASATLTQSSTTGGGTGFSITVDADNIDQYGEEYVYLLSNGKAKTYQSNQMVPLTISVGGLGGSGDYSAEGE